MTDSSSGVEVSPDEAFRLLGNETRMAILRSLWEHQDNREYALTDVSPVPFSRLQELTGVDDSGNFNYHLGELVGTLVTETDAGYGLSPLGAELMRALDTGVNFESDPMGPTALAEPCPFCGAALLGAYEGEHVSLRCPDCPGLEADGVFYKGRVPPQATRDRTIREVLEAELARYIAFDRLAGEGVCPACSAPLETELAACDDHRADDGICPTCDRRFATDRGASCTTCNAEAWSPALTYLTDVPAVRSFFDARGVDTSRALTLEFFLALNGHAEETVRATDPIVVEYAFDVDGDTLVATIKGRPDSPPTVSVDHP